MQFLTIARKDIRVLFRDRSAMIFIFGLPIIMTSIFGVIFGKQGKEPTRVPLKIRWHAGSYIEIPVVR